MDEAEIQAFADALEGANDFATPRTAIVRRIPALLGARRGAPAHWLGEALDALVAHIAAGQGPPLGAALLQRAEACGVLEQDCGEPTAWFVQRLAVRARAVAQPWVAIAVPDSAAPVAPPGRYEVRDLQHGVGVHHLRWYAEMRGTTAAAAFTGSATLRDAGVRLEGDPVRPCDAGALGRVLRGHPGRRRHRLRPAFADAVAAAMRGDGAQSGGVGP